VPLALAVLLVAGGLALGSSSVDPVQLRLLGVRLGQGAVAAAGVQILATEYGSGLIRMTLLAVPRRLDVLAAKAAVLTALVAPAAVLGVGVAVLGLSPDGGLLRAAFGSVLHLILIGLLGLGVAAVVRSSAAAMGIVLSLLYLMPMLLRMLPDPDWQRILYRTTPATAVQARPWQALSVDPLDGRRRELFKLAAPLFREHGYRGATIKALAHACHLTPAGLYHYFESKADFATYVIRQPHLDWRSVHVDPDIDALEQLRDFIDLAVRELPDFLLAMDLAAELPLPGIAHIRKAMFGEGDAVFGRYLAAVRPGLTPEAARDLARLVLSLLVGSHEIGPGRATDAATTRDRIVRVLRSELVPLAADGARFDRVMAGR
jgi:ABC-2 type transport system permease protein